MDEELPLVENVDENMEPRDEHEQRNENSEQQSSIESSLEESDQNNGQDPRNNELVQQANMDAPNLEDQQLLIYVEGEPDYPIIEDRSSEDEGNERDSLDRDGDSDHDMLIDLENDYGEVVQRPGDLPRIVIRDNNRDDINDHENSSEENDSNFGDNQDGDSAINVTSSSDEEESQNENEGQQDAETFDTELPAQHRYMGESREVGGRIILEEDLYVDIPIISQPGIILMPGQTLPMTFFQPAVISMMKRLVETTKTFGVLHKR